MNESRDLRPTTGAAQRHVEPSPECQPASAKPAFAKPKLTFIRPQLVKHGNVTELTGFFGAFSP